MSMTSLFEVRNDLFLYSDLRGVELDAAIGRAIRNLIQGRDTVDTGSGPQRARMADIGHLQRVIRLVGEVHPDDQRLYVWQGEVLWHDSGMSEGLLALAQRLVDKEMKRFRKE